jgi:DNA polymerase IIIc chi subunit
MRPLRLRIGYTSAPFWSVDAFHRQVLHETRERQETIDYLADLRNMRKVVLQTPDVSTLEKLSAALSSADPSPIPHHVWTEQPENITTCVALAPNRKEKSIRKALDKSSCRLWRSD